MMVEHHLGQQQPGEEPEGAAESAGAQEPRPPGIRGAEAESRPGSSGKAQSTFGLGRDWPRRRPALPIMGRGLVRAGNCPKNTGVFVRTARICVCSPALRNDARVPAGAAARAGLDGGAGCHGAALTG